MKWLFQSNASSILGLSRTTKRLIVVSIDVCACILATWLAFYLRLGEFVEIDENMTRPVGLSVAIALPIFAATGLYRAIFRFSGWPAIAAIGRAMAVYGLVYMTLIMAVGIDGTPRTIGMIQPLLLFFAIAGSRLLARFWLSGIYRTRRQKESLPRVVIYGAGSAGLQLAEALGNGYEMMTVDCMGMC